MIKKINRYLLLNRPQLWNTRVVWMAAIIALLHIIFYVCGYFSFTNYTQLHSSYSVNNNAIGNFNIGMSVLVTVLLLVLWLVFYLRNNPFKSFYPLHKAYFFSEFIIILAICLSGVLFYKSYAIGYCDSIQAATNDVDLTAELNTVNLAHGLIPSNENDYTLHSCCDSLEYLDSLQNLSYYDTTLTKGEKADIDTAIANFRERARFDERYNYFNYCRLYMYNLNSQYRDNEFDGPREGSAPLEFKSARHVSETIQTWLTAGNRQQVKKLLEKFNAMCQRYKVHRNINVMQYASLAFADPEFNISRVDFINSDGYGSDYTRAYLDFSNISNTLQCIYYVRNRALDSAFWLGNLYLALFLAIALFTFRLSSMKIWFISLIAAGVLTIIITVLAALINNEVANYFLLLFFIAAFYVLYRVFTKAGRKQLAGITLTWFTWSLPSFFFIIWMAMDEISRPDYYNAAGQYIYRKSPFHNFIHDNVEVFLLVNFVVMVLVVGGWLYRHYRQWMAMAEE